MNEFSLITTKSDHDYSSYNQSAITTTGTTIPLYTNSTKSYNIKKKSREKDKHFLSLFPSKTNSTEVFTNKDNIKCLQPFHDKKSLDKRSSINSIAFQYFKEPIRSCNMKQFPNFVHLSKSKNKQNLLRRFFFTFICLFVVILAIVFTILLIVRFS